MARRKEVEPYAWGLWFGRRPFYDKERWRSVGQWSSPPPDWHEWPPRAMTRSNINAWIQWGLNPVVMRYPLGGGKRKRPAAKRKVARKPAKPAAKRRVGVAKKKSRRGLTRR